MLNLRSAPLLLVGLACLVACDAQTTGVSAPSAERAAEAAARALVAEPGYTLHVELPPQATRGRQSIAHVRVEPRAPLHMNLDYPTKLQLRAPAGVELVASLLHKADAKRYDDQGLEFAVLFTPQARGAHKIMAQLDFAVCGDASCGPVSESLELAFDVSCPPDGPGLC